MFKAGSIAFWTLILLIKFSELHGAENSPALKTTCITVNSSMAVAVENVSKWGAKLTNGYSLSKDSQQIARYGIRSTSLATVLVLVANTNRAWWKSECGNEPIAVIGILTVSGDEKAASISIELRRYRFELKSEFNVHSFTRTKTKRVALPRCPDDELVILSSISGMASVIQ